MHELVQVAGDVGLRGPGQLYEFVHAFLALEKAVQELQAGGITKDGEPPGEQDHAIVRNRAWSFHTGMCVWEYMRHATMRWRQSGEFSSSPAGNDPGGQRTGKGGRRISTRAARELIPLAPEATAFTLTRRFFRT